MEQYTYFWLKEMDGLS